MNTPTTETIAASEARKDWSSLLNRVFKQHDRLIIEKSGIPVAVLISTDDYKQLQQVDERAERKALIEQFRAPFRDVDQDELQRELDRALAEVRAEMRAEREASKPAS
jgi:prevent-host-death family protein